MRSKEMKKLAPLHTHDDENNASLSPLSTITLYLDHIQKVNQMLGIGHSFKKRKIGGSGRDCSGDGEGML